MVRKSPRCYFRVRVLRKNKTFLTINIIIFIALLFIFLIIGHFVKVVWFVTTNDNESQEEFNQYVVYIYHSYCYTIYINFSPTDKLIFCCIPWHDSHQLSFFLLMTYWYYNENIFNVYHVIYSQRHPSAWFRIPRHTQIFDRLIPVIIENLLNSNTLFQP